MNMFIYPKYLEEASKSGWIVRTLRAFGVLQVIVSILIGATVGGQFLGVWLAQLGLMDYSAASASATLIGIAVGIVAGLWSSLPWFALAQVIDDLHAIRLQTGAYVAFESDNVHLGK